MRNLKKILALALALTMILSVTASAAFTDADKVDADYAESVDVLNGMDVFKGYPDGSFKPQGDITRAEVAAIIYRIDTQDVEDEKDDLFVGTAGFSDVPAAMWYAGYIGYCANAGYIKGYPDGTFRPQGKVTGMEALAMILRAVGYDAKNEFTGALWSSEIAKIATKEGILDDVKPGVLSGPATRELIAELLFEAIQIPTVRYNAIRENYVDDNEKGLGDAFDLTADAGNDDWGRPYTGWTYNTGNEETYYAEEALAAYTEKVDECDIIAAGDYDTDEKYPVYVNGVEKKVSLKDDDVTFEESAQGRLVEVYEDEIVVIDTYLAQVGDVYSEKTDKNGHVTREAYSEVKVWGCKETSGKIEGNDYAEDDYILVNYNAEEDYFEAVQLAESFAGAQTKVWRNASKRTIDGEDYPEAVNYALDEAGSSSSKHTWFLDQYGNVIGSADIDDLTKYAVLKDIIWNVGRPGSAEATIVFMDGSEETVIVNEFDEENVQFYQDPEDYDDQEPELCDDVSYQSYPDVSSDSKYNDEYEGYALYLVTYRADGTVNLDLAEIEVDEDEVEYLDVIVEHAYDVTLNTTTRQFLVDGDKYFVNTKTEILVNEDGEYKAYGIEDLEQFVFESAEIFFTVNSKGIATRIYVKSYASASDFGAYLFVTDDAWYQKAGSGKYIMNVIVDGVARDIITDKDTVEFLAANEEKLFYAVWDETYDADNEYDTYGWLEAALLINEETDDLDAYVDYLYAGEDEVFDADGNTIICVGDSYRIDDETVFIGGDDLDDVKNGKAWVVSYRGSNGIQYAEYVYCGVKLNDSTAMEINDTKADDKDTFTFVIPADKNAIDLVLKTSEPNAVIEIGETAKVGEMASPSTPAGTYTVTVYAEDGVATKVYTLVVNQTVLSSDATLKSVKVDGTEIEEAAPAAEAAVAAVKYLGAAEEFTMVVKANDAKATVYMGSGEDLDEAIADLEATTTTTVTETTAVNGGVVVVKVVAEDTSVLYYVFNTAAEPVVETPVEPETPAVCTCEFNYFYWDCDGCEATTHKYDHTCN